jgi:predicted negative regulator of RcsB-dependent stress response
MAVYDLEEQDQLEDLRAWWRRWGNLVTGVILAVSIGIIAVQAWRWWQQNQAEQASVLYTAVGAAVRANDVPKAKDAMAQLTDKYAGTGYAPRAALLMAKLLFDTGDKAGAKGQLAFVIDRTGEDELKQVARYRLAGIQLDDKAYDDALRTLDAKHDAAFAPLYADLRGDVLAAAGRPAEARTAYATALAAFDAKSPYRVYLQVKLDSLGGAPEAASAAAGTPATGAAPVAAAPAAATPPVASPAAPAAPATPAPAAPAPAK